MEIPVIALVGRPNVGKSTLFNCLTKSRDALVANIPGLTRDRQYGEGVIDNKDFIVVDTGGIGENNDGINEEMSEQTRIAIGDADIVMLLLDARAGLTGADQAIISQLRLINKPLVCVVNKTDGIEPNTAMSEFYVLGFDNMVPIAASQNRGIKQLAEMVMADFPEREEEESVEDQGIRLAIIGRPNVGKSTLVNRILGEDRVVVYDKPGTTRDSISIPFERQGVQYTIIDTAGIRRRKQVKEVIEKFSIVKTLKAIESSNVVLMMFDAQAGISDQDIRLLGFVLDAGKALVIAVNKWDGMLNDDRDWVKRELDRRLSFIDFADIHYISALHGTAVGHLFKSVQTAYASAMKTFTTPQLTEILTKAVERHQPPMVSGRRIKLRYAHPGGHNPPIVVIHGNQTERLPRSYIRYLEKTYRNALKMKGTPIRILLKKGDNPYDP